MDENVISWNLPNIITVIFMFMIIWMVFGAVGHFVFRSGAKQSTGSSTPFQVSPDLQDLGA